MDLPVGDSYEDICRKFDWQIPEYFNIADAVCDRWADDADGRMLFRRRHACLRKY